MVQKVKVLILCDFCFAEGKEVDATEVPVALNGGKEAPIGMCDEHREKLYAPLAAAYYEATGTKPPRTGKNAVQAPTAAKKAAPAPAKKAAAKKATPGRKVQTLKCAHCDAKFSTEKKKPGDPDGSYELKRPAMALSLHIRQEHPEAVAVTTEATNDPPAPATPSKTAEPVPA